jgi:hypothetical protein
MPQVVSSQVDLCNMRAMLGLHGKQVTNKAVAAKPRRMRAAICVQGGKLLPFGDGFASMPGGVRQRGGVGPAGLNFA